MGDESSRLLELPVATQTVPKTWNYPVVYQAVPRTPVAQCHNYSGVAEHTRPSLLTTSSIEPCIEVVETLPDGL